MSALILIATSFSSLVIVHPYIEYIHSLIQMYSMLEKLQIDAELCVNYQSLYELYEMNNDILIPFLEHFFSVSIHHIVHLIPHFFLFLSHFFANCKNSAGVELYI